LPIKKAFAPAPAGRYSGGMAAQKVTEPLTPSLNIVFIMADQLAAASLGCYGSGVASSPTLDRLAAGGARFERCYASSPVCAPNRATLLTGRSPSAHGIIFNNFRLRTDLPTYAHILAAHGYRLGGFGKFHLTPMGLPLPDNLAYLGFHETVLSEDQKWGAYLDWIKRDFPRYFETALVLCRPYPGVLDHYAPDLGRPAFDALRRRILGPRWEESGWPTMFVSPLPPELHQSVFITNGALDFMDRHLRDNPEKPFFCHVSYVDPHDPYDPPEPYASMFRPEDMPDPVPATWTDPGNAVLEKNRNALGFGRIARDLPMIRRMRALYHGSLRLLDDQVARIVRFLQDRGLWENTLLVFTTDHGDLLGDHEMIAKGVPPYDTAIRCPLIVSGGGVAPRVIDRLSCSLDFFPTFCDWAGVPEDARPPLEGRSFAVVCRGAPDPSSWPEVIVGFGAMQTIVTDDRWRLTIFDGSDAGQLIDLGGDPREQRNLYRDPAWAAKKAELLERLVRAGLRLGRVPHYRNLPVADGRRWLMDEDKVLLDRPRRDYELPPLAP
jgi:arylsulfatase A-like enzyme